MKLEPEVRDWLEGLSTTQSATAAFYVDLLAERGPLLSEPYTRQFDGKLRGLRFHLGGQAARVTYWIASGRRIVLLTVFGKTWMRQVREIDRACGRCGYVLLRATPWTMTARSEGDVRAAV